MDDVARSRTLSYVLRHRPDTMGLVLDHQGWVDVTRLLDALTAHRTPLTREELGDVVATSDKQRFEWDRGRDVIRARQGHSVHVDLALDAATPPSELFHGTSKRALDAILATGLDRRSRHHVHLSADVEVAHRVGARHGGAPVVLAVDAAAMTADGLDFWVTSNHVWLTHAVAPYYLDVRR